MAPPFFEAGPFFLSPGVSLQYAAPRLHKHIKGNKALITLSVRGLPQSTTEETLTALFAEYGKIRSIKLVRDIFSGNCKGFATVDMEGHEARAAMAALDGRDFNGSLIRVGPDRPRKARGKRRY